jgi:hypothetical protein
MFGERKITPLISPYYGQRCSHTTKVQGGPTISRQLTSVWESSSNDNPPLDDWEKVVDPDVFPFFDDGSFADFTVVPVPAAVWLFGSGLLGLIGISRRKKSA